MLQLYFAKSWGIGDCGGGLELHAATLSSALDNNNREVEGQVCPGVSRFFVKRENIGWHTKIGPQHVRTQGGKSNILG